MELEEFSVELYNNLGESRLAIAGFGDLLLRITDKSEKVNGELKIAHNNFVNIDLLSTNLMMLEHEILKKEDSNKIILLNESYFSKLGSIGTLTLEQIASSLMGEYNPFNPGKKVKFNKIKETIENYAGSELRDSFLEGFCGIFNEVKETRNRAAHANLESQIFFKENIPYREKDSLVNWIKTGENPHSKKYLYSSKIKKDSPDFFKKGDLILSLNGNFSGLTDKLNEYGSKYLKMVTDVYNGLTDLRKGFIVGNKITYPGGKKSESFYVDTFPKKLDEVPFIIELGK